MIQDPVLIVDDEPDARSLLLEALQSQGYFAETAAGGREALARMTERGFSVVLTDLHMPGGISGLELMSIIRVRHPETLCILVTAYATLETSIEALKHGAYDLIQKPFRLAEIEVVLNRALEHARLVRQVSVYREELETRILSRTQDLQEAHQEALMLSDLSLRGLDAETPGAALAPLLDWLGARWSPTGLACYRLAQDGLLSALTRRGPRPLPVALKRPRPGPVAPSQGMGYPEERLLPLGHVGWLYLGFEERTAFSENDPVFRLLARHMELLLRVR